MIMLNLPMPASPLLLPIYGDSIHNDMPVIRHLLNKGMAFDVRTNDVIVAPTLRDLPCGLYLLTSAMLEFPHDEMAN